jgi:hypothetical protein
MNIRKWFINKFGGIILKEKIELFEQARIAAEAEGYLYRKERIRLVNFDHQVELERQALKRQSEEYIRLVEEENKKDGRRMAY